MANALKKIAVLLLALGLIGSLFIANIGRDFSFTIFLVCVCVDTIYFLLMYGIGSIWERQDVIESEHAEIIRILKGNNPKIEKDKKSMYASFENRQIEILNLLKSSAPRIADPDLAVSEAAQKVDEPETVQDDLPRAVVVERTYDDIKRRKANGGWKCKKCGKTNSMSRRTCTECGEPR